ncbi:MAG: ABC transporter ATP-binding protein [Deltaproteobacteria bacterium]|jgi:putative ABC transport system ATP-binding protein|nr:ABC transporter ATP-binding protein [Deltaproteobacteria bacterium]
MAAEPAALKEDPPAAEFADVTYAWPGERPVIKNLSLSVPGGGRLFISGPSGCGKSTLLSLAAGVLIPQEGEVRLSGRSLRDLSGPRRDRLRGESVGYVFQQFNLVPYLTPLENVILPCRFSSSRRKRALLGVKSLKDAASGLLSRLGIPAGLWTKPSVRLSVGQQQRVAAARALMGRPGILIADEPTSALDRESGRLFLELLLKECGEAGSGLLFVSHDESLAPYFSQRLTLSPPDISGRETS